MSLITENATTYHVYRVHLQIVQWKTLMCGPGHDATLHPSSATGNQQRLCAGPKPGQRRKVCQMGGDTLAVKDQDD